MSVDENSRTDMHPAPGACPGETVAIGPGHRWLAYAAEGGMVVACYPDGRLLRRDMAGWWAAGPRGERHPVPDGVVAALVGTAPEGWPVLDEQAPLLGVAALRGEVAS